MNFEIDPEIEKHPDLLAGVEGANRYLATLGGRYTLPISAAWRLIRNTPAGTGLEMKLVIEKDAAIRSFTPSDFRVPETWKNHIKQAWWDLIDDFQRHTGERILKLLGDWKKELATVGEK